MFCYTIGTYGWTVYDLLESYAPNANIVEAVSEMNQLVKLAPESVIQFAESFCLRAFRCGNAYYDERIKKMLIDGLPLTICSGAGMFLGSQIRCSSSGALTVC